MNKKYRPNTDRPTDRPTNQPPNQPTNQPTILDDIFMIWEYSKEDFYKFVKILNTHHPSITVKAELSSE